MNGTTKMVVGGLIFILGIAFIAMLEGTGVRILGVAGLGTGILLISNGRVLRKKEK